MAPGFHGVRQHHGIIDGADIGAATILRAGEDFQIIFRILENLEHGGISEKWAQQRKGGFGGNLRGCGGREHIAHAAMTDRHIAGATRRDGE